MSIAATLLPFWLTSIAVFINTGLVLYGNPVLYIYTFIEIYFSINTLPYSFVYFYYI